MMSVILLIIAILLNPAASRLLKRRTKYLNGLDAFIGKCKRYKAVVLDVNDVPTDKSGNTVRAVILQFRDEEQKRTVVHRYTDSSGKRYYRGSEVELYYCEESDTACIKDDNPFTRNASRLMTYAILMRILSALCIIAAIIVIIV